MKSFHIIWLASVVWGCFGAMATMVVSGWVPSQGSIAFVSLLALQLAAVARMWGTDLDLEKSDD